MFKDFLSALTLEMLRSLQKGTEFKGPAVFRDYLASASEDQLLSDLRLAFQVINGTELSALNLKGSSLFKAAVKFFVDDFASKLDHLGSNFYLLPYEERKKQLEQLVHGDAHLATALRELLVTNSYQEITEALEMLAKATADSATIVVQAPRDIAAELKKEMRAKFAEEYPYSFPSFQINRQLIGGFRVFINGKSHDLSWFSQVQKLTSLKS
jgi:F0F1-type ATP synthase delta subunit